MTEEVNFYGVYPEFRHREPPILKDKHIRQYDEEFWTPSGCRADMAVLEIGSGAGLFLAYLERKGIADFMGLDLDASVLEGLPESLKGRLRIGNVWTFLEGGADGRTFDRIALFDVLEHFTPSEGVRLLKALDRIMRPGGRIVVRVPNAGSPWGLQYQHHDLTHKAAYNDGSIRQLALAAGLDCLAALPQKRKRGLRRHTEDAFHWLLSRILTEAPGIWSANFLAVLGRREGP